MPYSRFAVDALGVITIILVSILVLAGLCCILYLIYFHTKIRGQGYSQLGYFHGPWIIRITFILFAIWWGFGEVVRLNLIRGDRRLLSALSFRWQETVCKYYIVSSLGFAEPCLYLTVVFLLRASLQKSGTLSQKWNGKTIGYILLFCLPVFALQLMLILAGPEYRKNHMKHLPHYFTSPVALYKNDVALCTYPLLSTFCLGLFAIMLTSYLFWLGGRILHLVINRSLQKRVYMLVVSVSAFFPIRILLLGLTVRTQPEHFPFQALAFLGFVSFFFCIGMGMFMLIIMPMRDCLALKKSSERDIEARRRLSDEQNDTVSLIANQSTLGGSMVSSPGRDFNYSLDLEQSKHKWRSPSQFSQSLLRLSLFVHSLELQWQPTLRHRHLLLPLDLSPRHFPPVVLSLCSLSSLDLRSGFEVLKSRERDELVSIYCFFIVCI